MDRRILFGFKFISYGAIIFAFFLSSMRIAWCAEENGPLIRLQPQTPLQSYANDNSNALDPNATHISRAAMLYEHPFKNAMEMFGLLVVKYQDSLIVRSITPIRIGNGSIGFTLEQFDHNLPFINAHEFSIFLPTKDAEYKISALIAKGALKEIPKLTEEEKILLSTTSYQVTHAKISQKISLSTKAQPLPGDDLERIFIVGHVVNWQHQVRDGKLLGYAGGRIIPLIKSEQ